MGDHVFLAWNDGPDYGDNNWEIYHAGPGQAPTALTGGRHYWVKRDLEPRGICSEDGALALYEYIHRSGEPRILSVVDMTTGAETELTRTTDLNPWQAFMSRDGRYVFVAGGAGSEGGYRILVDDFYRSSESRALYGGLSTQPQISRVFQFLFARNPETAGLGYWSGLVDSGRISLAEMAYTIAYNAAAADQAVLDAKVAAAQAFNEALRRVQQTQTCAMNADDARTFLARVRNQAEADTEIARIDTTVRLMCP